jgi:antitoxin VapB
MVMTCHVSLNLKGDEQILMIPREFAMSGTEVLLRKEGDRLIIDLIPAKSLLTTLQSLQAIADPFPDFDTGLMPLDDTTL